MNIIDAIAVLLAFISALMACGMLSRMFAKKEKE